MSLPLNRGTCIAILQHPKDKLIHSYNIEKRDKDIMHRIASIRDIAVGTNTT